MPSFPRLLYIDTLRGMAIVCMLVVNSAPFFLVWDTPFWFRIITSVAAPTFIAVSGYLLGVVKERERFSFVRKSLIRGGLFILIAVLIDLFIWGIIPSLTMDILYLIGIAVIISPLVAKLPKFWHFMLAMVLMIFPLYIIWGYHLDVYCLKCFHFESELWQANVTHTLSYFDVQEDFSILRMLQSWLVDGRFPIFPWLGIYLICFWFGMYFDRMQKSELIENNYQVVFSLVVMIAGIIYLAHSERPIRLGFSELYYPPDFVFLITILMFLYFILFIPRHVLEHKIFYPFRIMGQSSLMLYVVHIILIVYVLPYIFSAFNKSYFLTFCCFIIMVYGIAYALHRLKRTDFWRKSPFLLRFIFGA
ncbi:MAG: heparan-alpha-glucosaminide N-acetyltransferase domain-containing protein [Bacteroidales bacterium]|nr:heparan-alpha-glucosaminide N-acetyltransferase domain-containing protein [Bacteroidales bacterium]